MPVPGVETWIYIGANLSESDQELDQPRHYFERPDVYFAAEIAKENESIPREVNDNEDLSNLPDRMTVVQDALEALIYDYDCFCEWVENLKSESNADEVF